MGVERGVDCAVEAPATQLAQYGQCAVGVHQRLAAADGHAAAAVLHDVALLLDLAHQLVHRVLAAADLPGLRRAVVGYKTLLLTRVTADALRPFVKHLRLGRPALRVVAPHAAQRAALHEYGCTDARPVVDGVSFDIEDVHLLINLDAKLALLFLTPKYSAQKDFRPVSCNSLKKVVNLQRTSY